MREVKTILNHHEQKQTNEQCLTTTHGKSYNHQNKLERLKTISQNRSNINETMKGLITKQLVCAFLK